MCLTEVWHRRPDIRSAVVRTSGQTWPLEARTLTKVSASGSDFSEATDMRGDHMRHNPSPEGPFPANISDDLRPGHQTHPIQDSLSEHDSWPAPKGAGNNFRLRATPLLCGPPCKLRSINFGFESTRCSRAHARARDHGPILRLLWYAGERGSWSPSARERTACSL